MRNHQEIGTMQPQIRNVAPTQNCTSLESLLGVDDLGGIWLSLFNLK